MVIRPATMSPVVVSVAVPLIAPAGASIESSIDVDARTADVKIGDLVESNGRPIISPFTGDPVRSGISLPGGFHYTFAEMGNGNSKVRAGIELDLKDSYGQFNVLHMSQDGVIR